MKDNQSHLHHKCIVSCYDFRFFSMVLGTKRLAKKVVRTTMVTRSYMK